MAGSPRMSRPVALRTIRALAGEDEKVVFLRHAKKRRAQRHIDPARILTVLRRGQIIEGPALDAHGCWRCTMERFLTGEDVTVVVSICDDELVVVTAY